MQTIQEEEHNEVQQEKALIEHILLNPDSYIGSTEVISSDQWVWDKRSSSIDKKTIQFAPGFYKIFDEILVHAVENYSKLIDRLYTIKITIDKASRMITIMYNKATIPIEDFKEKVSCAELVFGNLTTSSMYFNEEKEILSGTKVKRLPLTNVFSRKFIVEIANSQEEKKFTQIFTNNMKEKNPPSIKKYLGKDYTWISFVPDLARFHMKSLNEDVISLMTKRVYDVAGVSPKRIKIFLNGECLKIPDFEHYAGLYFKNKESEDEKQIVIRHKKGNNLEVIATRSDVDFNQISFVNSICTTLGGTHVNYVVDQITDHIQKVFKERNRYEVDSEQIKCKF